MEDREWMYTGRASQGQVTNEWIDKTDAFLERAFGVAAKGASKICCPCSKCANRKRQTKKVMGEHLWKNGFTADYTRWVYHGEADRIREEVVRPRVEDYDADAGVADMLNDYHEAQFAEGRTEEEPEATAKAFYDMFAAAQKPLHGQTKVSQLDAIGRIMALKSQYSLSRDAFDGMLTVIGSLLPEGHLLPKSMHESQKLLRALKMPYEQIHACPKGCVLFRKEYVEAKYCPKCKSSRFLEVDSGDGQKRQLDIPVTILRHLPFIPRIQRLYMTEESAKQMTWHKNGKRYNPDRMVHASDGEAWTHFDGIHHEKAKEARNVRVALATDGFNPYGMMAAPYTCWPVFVIPLNLPPGVCFQRQNVFLSLIIPGHPGNNMGVFMEPVIDELVRAWEEGVWTYDRATKKNFKMHVWYHYSLHDFLAYGIFCAWCVHGKFPCPVCKEGLRFIWLKKGGKYSSFDKHRQFLPLDHAFRRDIKNFTKGVVVTDPAPPIMTGAAVREQIDGLVVNPEGGFVGYGEQHMWTHKSGLTRLPYFGDGAIDSAATPSLSQIRSRAGSTSTRPAIRPRQDTSHHRVEALEAQLEQERRIREQMQAKMERVEAERQAEQRRMAEILQYMQSLGAATGVTPPPSLFAPPPPPPPNYSTPNQSAGSNDPHAPVNPSPNQSHWPSW